MFNTFQGAHIHCISQDMLGYAVVIKSSKISKFNITTIFVYTLWPSYGGIYFAIRWLSGPSHKSQDLSQHECPQASLQWEGCVANQSRFIPVSTRDWHIALLLVIHRPKHFPWQCLPSKQGQLLSYSKKNQKHIWNCYQVITCLLAH